MRFQCDVRGQWKQYYAEETQEMSIKILEIDVSKETIDNQKEIIKERSSEIQRSLNIAVGQVIGIGLFTGVIDGYQRLLIAVHHLIIDGISWRVLLDDFLSLYEQISTGVGVRLLPKTSSYKQWGDALLNYTKSERVQKHWDYWLKVGERASLLPVDTIVESITVNDMVNYIVGLSKDETTFLLNKVPQAYNTQINDILLSALTLTFQWWTGCSDLLLHLEGHGREDCVEGVDVSQTIGWFTSLFPVHIHLPKQLSQNGCLSEVIKSVKEQLRMVPDKGLSYGVLRYLSNDIRAPSPPLKC
ncbi:MAG: condensation domain-containing protein, partial [Actinobacteria bacterium]|nr:condensation domain-containing protein [Actinomycetota bacterium]